jgi:S-(hydroxymethyl)glutathione dehydrogenase / alcohol dehydrogenase
VPSIRAAVLRSVPGKLSVEDVELAPPLADEVLVRTAAAGLCHSDLHLMGGAQACPTPAVLGHEAAGVVEAVGAAVTGVSPGDHVVACLSAFCGACEFCLSGRPSLCDRHAVSQRPPGADPRLRDGDGPLFPFAGLASFAERMVVHHRACVKIPAEVPLDRAALLGCAVTTGLGAVFRTARVEPGMTVAVVGCGGVGLNCVQGAAIAGAGRIIAVDREPAKLEAAVEFGATDTVQGADPGADDTVDDTVDRVRRLSGGGVHHAFEAVGLKATAEQAFAMLRRGGTATVVGLIPLGQAVEVPGRELFAEKRLQGSHMGSNRFRIDIPRYVDLYLRGRLKLDELISRRMTLDEVNDGFDAMRTGAVRRSVIVF